MLRRLRRKLREIEYYSATRRRTVSQRVLDAGMFVAIVLAVLSAWVSDALVTHTVTGTLIYGKLGRERDAASGRERLVARLTDGPNERFPWSSLISVGEFRITPELVSRGLPLATTRASAFAIVTVRFFDQPAALTLTRDQLDPEVRDAIRAALETDTERAGVAEALRVWTNAPSDSTRASGGGEGEASTRGRAMVWIGNVVAWWLAWMIGLALVVHLARGGHWLALTMRRSITRARHAHYHARRQSRRAGNLCPECGYDMRGLEFSERCPECGTISV